MEALVRLRSPGKPIVASQFVPTAERFGLMPAIDRWVLKQVQHTLRERPDLPIFVNLAASSFADDNLLDAIEIEVAHAKHAGARIGVEITEASAIGDLKRAQRRLTSLRELGCLIALDDFGVGFTSFAELAALPIDYVKIGEPFTNGWTTDYTRSLAIIKAIVDVAHAFDICVIAETVETDQVAEELHTLGVEYAQGFLFSEPIPAHNERPALDTNPITPSAKGAAA